MELNEIFFNLMMTCLVVLSLLVVIGILADEKKISKLNEMIVVKVFVNLSFYGFPLALIGWIWTR